MPQNSDLPVRPPVILFMHTDEISMGFVAGQLGYFGEQGFDVHYAAGFAEPNRVPSVAGATTWHLPLVRPPAPRADLVALVAIVRLLRRVRPDVVHCGTPKAGLLGSLGSLLARVPVRIYAVHGLRYESERGRKRQLLCALERIAMRCATAVLADGESVRQRIISDLGLAPDRVHVAPPGSSNGVDLSRFTPPDNARTASEARSALGLRPLDPVIGFVGRLVGSKGIDDLVQIHRTIRARGPIQLLLIGRVEPDDPITPVTAAYIAADADVVHVDWTTEPEVAYRAIDVLVFPSYREGLPNVPLEAQASGVPVVGYAATGTVDAVATSDCLVPVGDIDALAGRVGDLLNDAGARAASAAAALTWVRRFDRQAVWASRLDFVRRQLAAAGVVT